MQIPGEKQTPSDVSRSNPIEQRRSIAYSMDALIPGFYIWFHSVHLRIGGSQAATSYPGIIHSTMGIAIVLPGYHIFTTYQDSYEG